MTDRQPDASDVSTDGDEEQPAETTDGWTTERATAAGAAASTGADYKVLGEIDTPGKTGVLGTNTAASGNAFGVVGLTPNASDGYGLYTPDKAYVGGGEANDATGRSASVPGGNANEASGEYSFAAGRFATASANGTFVWGDSSTQSVTSNQTDEFKVQAGGGAIVYSSSDLSTGVNLAPGDGTWSSASARAIKTGVEPVDPPEVLERVRSLDVATWQYETRPGVDHMRPMAGEFHDAFGLGADDEHIAGVDADGVALAAIQGLADRLDEARERLERKDERIADLEARVAALEADDACADGRPTPADD